MLLKAKNREHLKIEKLKKFSHRVKFSYQLKLLSLTSLLTVLQFLFQKELENVLKGKKHRCWDWEQSHEQATRFS